MKRKILSIGLILCLCTGHVFAAKTHKKVGTTAAQFLKIGLGGRPTGMGGAYVGVAEGASALYWNPAGLAFLKEREVLTQHIEWFQDINYENVMAAFPLENDITVGAGINYLYVKDIERRTDDTELPLGYFGASDKAGIVSVSKKMQDNMSVGVNAKYIHSNIDDESASAFAIDAGALYKVNSELNIGFVVQNLGTKMKFISQADPLPLNIKLGAGYFIKKFTFACDLNMPNDNYLNVALGAEYVLSFDDRFTMPIRIGYKTLNDLEAINGLSAGVGFGYKQGRFDFAWVPYGSDLGDTYRISLTLKFPSKIRS